MIRRLLNLNNVNFNSVHYSDRGEIMLDLGVNEDRCHLFFPIPWFYNQVSVESIPNRFCGLYELIDDDLINYVHNKSFTMLKIDLAKHYKVVFSNIVIDVVVTGKLTMKDKSDNIIDCFLNDEVDLADFESISNLIDIFDLITGNIEFDDTEQFVIDSEVSYRFQRPIEINNMVIDNNCFDLFLTANHGKIEYEIFSNTMPDLIQFAEELVTDDAFTKTHKNNKALGTVYEVSTSSMLKKIEHTDSELKMLRIEDSEIPMDIVTSDSLFYREINNSMKSKWNALM